MPEEPTTKPPLPDYYETADAMDECLANANTHISRALHDPLVPTGARAPISITMQRQQLFALAQALKFMGVPEVPDFEYLPPDWPSIHQN